MNTAEQAIEQADPITDAMDHDDKDDLELTRLAELSVLEYEQQRKEAADKLGIGRVTMLDTLVKQRKSELKQEEEQADMGDELLQGIEPYPEAVNGQQLANSILEAYQRYIIMPEGGHVAIALWTLASYCIDAFRIFPKLCLSSPEKRCGKTTTMELLTAMVHRGLPCSNVSVAVIFRAVDAWKPSLLIDEGDTFLNGNEELRGIINSGHTRGTASVLRVESNGTGHEPKRFSTWAPMAIAMINTPPDTIRDRSVMIRLRRKMPGETVERLPIEADKIHRMLRQQCQRWALDHSDALTDSKPLMPKTGSDRTEDNWRPLLAIAECIGGNWPDEARKAMVAIEGASANDEDAIGPQILSDIRDIFAEIKLSKITSQDLVEKLVNIEEAPWSEWRLGKPMTKTSLARLLKPYGIKSKTIRIGYNTKKGYAHEQFEDAFARYLSPDSSVTASQASNHAASNVTFQNDVTVQASHNTPNVTRNPSNHAGCDVVTDETEDNGNVSTPPD